MHPNFNWWIHSDYLKTVITMYSACPHWVFGSLPPVWGTRTFDRGMQTDSESEEDGREGELCVRGEHHLQSITMG